MRYDGFHIIMLVVCVLLFSACKSRKEITRSVTEQKRTEQTETAIDTSHTVVSDKEVISREVGVSEDIYSRTQHFDSLGNIRSIQEVWRRIGRFELALHERSGSYLSLNGMSTVTSDRDSSTMVIYEHENSSADTRPVQGEEWIWLIVGIGLLILLIIKFYLKR